MGVSCGSGISLGTILGKKAGGGGGIGRNLWLCGRGGCADLSCASRKLLVVLFTAVAIALTLPISDMSTKITKQSDLLTDCICENLLGPLP